MRAKLRVFGSETFSSLRHRNFRLFFFGQWTSQVGTWMTLVASTLLVLKITGSGVAVGLLTACQFGPFLVLGAWSGVIADRSDKRRLLLWVQVAAMLKSFAFAALAFMPHPPVAGFYAIAVVGGVTVALDNPARRAFVVEMVPTEDMNNAVSMNTALMTASRIFGPALAGLIATTAGFGWCFMADGLSYIAVLAAYSRMDTTKLRTPEPTPRAKGQIREGFRYARSIPELFVPLLMLAVIGTLAFNFQVFMPLFATRTLGGDDGDFTILYSVLSLGSFIGALVLARRTQVTIRHVATASALFGLGLLGLSVAPNFGVAIVMSLLVGTVSVGFITSSTDDRPNESRPGSAGTGAGLAVDPLLRNDTDRRSDHRRNLRSVRCSGRDRRRRLFVPRRRGRAGRWRSAG